MVDPLEIFAENHTEAEVAEIEKILPDAFVEVTGKLTENYVSARNEAEKT